MIERYYLDLGINAGMRKSPNGEWCEWGDAEEERKKAYKQGYNDSVKALIKIIRELGDSAFKKLEENFNSE